MAELILSPIVTVVVEMLGSTTVEKLGSLWGVEDDLADLKLSLLSIQAVLLDAEEKQSHNHRVRLWLQRLEDVVDEADDLFNEVATEGLRRQLAPATTWKKIRTSPARLKFRYNMAKEIRSVKKKMAKIAADKKDFQLESRDEIVRPTGSGRETRSFVDEEQVFGRVGDKREVLELMMNPESRVGQDRVSRNDSITRLPTSITKLVNLQTLKLTGCRSLCELPTSIGKLVNLRHLIWCPNVRLLLPRGVSQLINLRTLSYLTLSEDPTHITLDDLLGLDNLRGHVTIQEIRNGMKLNGAILKDKKLVRVLQLHWSNKHIHGANQEVEMTLEGLQPNQNLRALTVYGYGGIKFSDWLSSLRNLVKLELRSCPKLMQLSSLESFCSLREINVSNCDEMEYIVMDINGALEAPIPVFPSLQCMVLSDLDKFKGWKCSNIDGVQLLSYFPCLTSLQVCHCPELISMPLYPNVKDLYLENTKQLPFEQTVTAYHAHPQISQASATTCSSSPSPSSTPRFYPLVTVTNLCLCCRNITDVQYFPDWMQSFSCLETLEISESKSFSLTDDRMTWIIKEGDEHQMSTGGNRTGWEIFSGVCELELQGVSILKHVSLAAQYLTSLENLVIRGESEELDFNWEGLPILHKEMFSRLKSLYISGCRNLSGIPNWIFKLSSLQQLQIITWEKLESMPVSLSSLTSLQCLMIWMCPSMLTLDEEIEWDALVSLQSLELYDLPKLVTLPSGLQHATTLQTLHLNSCENLSALPDWIDNLSSLQRLKIHCCPKIESLPGSIKSLTSLQKLEIRGCPSLWKRCRRDTGEDWPNICHINNIYI